MPGMRAFAGIVAVERDEILDAPAGQVAVAFVLAFVVAERAVVLFAAGHLRDVVKLPLLSRSCLVWLLLRPFARSSLRAPRHGIALPSWASIGCGSIPEIPD